MNKAVMISIAPKWFKMIKEGIKTLEFRNYGIPKGTKVYLRETFGKLVSCDKCVGHKGIVPFKYHEFTVDYENCSCTDLEPYNKDGYYHEGTGQVVAEFVVGEEYELTRESHMMAVLSTGANLEGWGYTNQKYAMKITDLIVYDEPIHWNEFVSWNKLVKYKKDINKLERKTGCVGYYIEDEEHAYNIGKSWESVEENKFQNLKWDMYITSPPQGKIYVVEKEWNNE